MRFDAYVSTFSDLNAHQLAEDVQRVVEDAADGIAMHWEPSSAKHGYAHAVALLENTEEKRRNVYAVLRYGGNAGTCNVEVKGEPSPVFARWCRADHPTHRLSRADVCIDLTAPGLFEAAERALTTISDEHRVKTRVAGDWKRGVGGRSLYLGAPSSDFQLILYEKGKQLIGQGVPHADPNHVRLEFKVKARKHLKVLLAHMEHADFWGLTEWSRASLEAFSGLTADRVVRSVYRLPDHERAVAWMLRQYGPHLLEEVRQRGGWERFGEYAEKQIASGGVPDIIRAAA